MGDDAEGDILMGMFNIEISGGINIDTKSIDTQINQAVNLEQTIFVQEVNPHPSEVIGATTQLLEQTEAAAVARENRAAEVAGTMTIAEAEARHQTYVQRQEDIFKNSQREYESALQSLRADIRSARDGQARHRAACVDRRKSRSLTQRNLVTQGSNKRDECRGQDP